MHVVLCAGNLTCANVRLLFRFDICLFNPYDLKKCLMNFRNNERMNLARAKIVSYLKSCVIPVL